VLAEIRAPSARTQDELSAGRRPPCAEAAGTLGRPGDAPDFAMLAVIEALSASLRADRAGFICWSGWGSAALRKTSCGLLGVGYTPFKDVDLFGKASVSAGAFSIWSKCGAEGTAGESNEWYGPNREGHPTHCVSNHTRPSLKKPRNTTLRGFFFWNLLEQLGHYSLTSGRASVWRFGCLRTFTICRRDVRHVTARWSLYTYSRISSMKTRRFGPIGALFAAPVWIANRHPTISLSTD
jgi:hypothetical protein